MSASGVSVGASSVSAADLRSSTEDAVERLAGVPAKPEAHDESTAPPKPAEPSKPTAPRNGDAPVEPTPAAHPVGGVAVSVVESVTEGLAGGLAEVRAKVPPLAALPTLPTLPTLPALPALPSMPVAPETPSWPSWPGMEVPEFPGLPGTDLPGADLPAFPGLPAVPGRTLPAPGTWTPQPGFEAPESGDGRDAEGRTGKEAGVECGPGVGVGAGAGFDVIVAHTPASGGTHSSEPSGYAPVRQAPVEHPGGVQGNRSAGDSSQPRHGDAHAVSLNPRAPLRLVPGAAARVEADEIQDRHRDIPVSPA
jgi:hypothetical protein